MHARLIMERLLRATGAFRVTKRRIQDLETIGFQATTLPMRLRQGSSWPRRRRGNVVMFHTGRSGSSVVADLLMQHPDFRWDGELFNSYLQFWRRIQRARQGEAQRLIGRRMNCFDVPYYGFEILPSQLNAGNIDKEDFARAMDDLGFGHFILLTRRNILRRIVSHLVARERGRWRMRSGEIAPLTRIHVNTENLQLASSKPLLDHLRDVRAEYAALRELLSSRRCLQLVYEDDVLPDPRLAMRKVCAFLGIKYRILPVRHARTTPQALNEIVQNFPEVERALAGTEFEWMLGTEPNAVS
jgi:hypothetical protein